MNIPKPSSHVPSEPLVHWQDEDLPSLPPGRLADPTPDPNAPSLEELRQRFPRTVTELRVLEALRLVAPLTLSPLQLALLMRMDALELCTILTALKLVGAVEYPARGLYRHRPL